MCYSPKQGNSPDCHRHRLPRLPGTDGGKSHCQVTTWTDYETVMCKRILAGVFSVPLTVVWHLQRLCFSLLVTMLRLFVLVCRGFASFFINCSPRFFFFFFLISLWLLCICICSHFNVFDVFGICCDCEVFSFLHSFAAFAIHAFVHFCFTFQS